MAPDISRNVVAILLVLVIVVAAIGTWAFLAAFEPVDGAPYSQPAAGEVRLRIGDLPAPPQSAESADVALRIATEDP